jgi:hypothetical protein
MPAGMERPILGVAPERVPGAGTLEVAMHFHTPFHPIQHFHPFQAHPMDGTSLEALNLALILVGAVLVLLLGLL